MSSTTDAWAEPYATLQEREPRRSQLLAEAIDKPVTLFRQWDAWVPVEIYARDSITGSGDGFTPTITGGWTWELRRGTPVRVQVTQDIGREDVIKALRAIADVIEREDWSRDLPF